MASIQESVNKEVWDLFLRFFGTGSEFVYQIAHEGNVAMKQGGEFIEKYLTALINRNNEAGEPTDALETMYKRSHNGESINAMAVAEEDQQKLKTILESKDILYSVIPDPNDDKVFFTYMSGDTARFMDAISVFQAEKRLVSELNPDLFLDNFAKEGIGVLTGLNAVDLEMFRRYARENKLVFTSTPTDERGKFAIIYDTKDKDAVRKTMESTVWAFSGPQGRQFRERVRDFLINKQAITMSLEQGEKEFYIVDSALPEKVVHLTANDFTYHKNSNLVVSESRNSPVFMETALRVCGGFAAPVLLTREEYEHFKENGELDKDAVEKTVAEKANGVTKEADLIELQRAQDNRLVTIQEKMSLIGENIYGLWLFDNVVERTTNSSYEEVEDIDDQTKEDMREAQGHANEFVFNEFEAYDNRSIDYLISEAEKRRREFKREEREPERETIESEQEI